jgi:hypothetical protein
MDMATYVRLEEEIKQDTDKLYNEYNSLNIIKKIAAQAWSDYASYRKMLEEAEAVKG